MREFIKAIAKNSELILDRSINDDELERFIFAKAV